MKKNAVLICLVVSAVTIIVMGISSYVLPNIFFGIIISLGLSFMAGLLLDKRLKKTLSKLFNYITRLSQKKMDHEIQLMAFEPEYLPLALAVKENTEELREAIRNEEEKNIYLLNTINGMENGFIALNKEDEITLINKEGCRIFSIEKPGDVYMKSIFLATQNLKLLEVLGEKHEEAYEAELELEQRIYRMWVYPLRDGEGHFLGRLLLFSDITKIRGLETMRKEFVANVSHELKTPLTSIRGFIDTLKDGAVEDREMTMKFLNIIDVESERLGDLIEDILVLSDIETPREHFYEERVSINNLIEEIKGVLVPIAEKNGIILAYNVEDDLYANGRKEWFKQILSNLLSNAIQYSFPGGEVSLEAYSEGENLKIQVKDRGIGISPEDQERIFERFYKVDKSRSRNPESTGLGLSIVKHIVSLYNGYIEVESELGKGSLFKVTLPVIKGGEEK